MGRVTVMRIDPALLQPMIFDSSFSMPAISQLPLGDGQATLRVLSDAVCILFRPVALPALLSLY